MILILNLIFKAPHQVCQHGIPDCQGTFVGPACCLAEERANNCDLDIDEAHVAPIVLDHLLVVDPPLLLLVLVRFLVLVCFLLLKILVLGGPLFAPVLVIVERIVLRPSSGASVRSSGQPSSPCVSGRGCPAIALQGGLKAGGVRVYSPGGRGALGGGGGAVFQQQRLFRFRDDFLLLEERRDFFLSSGSTRPGSRA